MATHTLSFAAYSSSTPFSDKSPASTSRNYPLASKIIVKIKLIKDEGGQKSKGFAFIQYTSQEAALLALESMDYQLFDERRVFVEVAKPRRIDFWWVSKNLRSSSTTTRGD